MPNQLFHISAEAYHSTSTDIVNSIVADLTEMGLYRLPYECVDVCLPFNGIAQNPDTGELYHGLETRDWIFIFRDIVTDSYELCKGEVWEGNCPLYLEPDILNLQFPWTTGEVASLLISLLATKGGIIQDVREPSKLGKLGIGKSKTKSPLRTQRTTFIRLDPQLIAESIESGRTVRPHLRRGHIRRVHYGVGRQLTRKVWIEPTIVNASADFVEDRALYSIG